MPYRAALHKDNGLLTISSNGRGGQPEHVFRFGLLQDRIKRRCTNVVTLVDDDMAIVFNQGIDLALARHRLHHCNIDLACGLGLATANGAN